MRYATLQAAPNYLTPEDRFGILNAVAAMEKEGHSVAGIDLGLDSLGVASFLKQIDGVVLMSRWEVCPRARGIRLICYVHGIPCLDWPGLVPTTSRVSVTIRPSIQNFWSGRD